MSCYNNIFLGIDTSCYTTSFVICDDSENIVFEYRKLLTVKNGSRGLRQSEAVFQHIKNFDELFNAVPYSKYGKISAVCASVKPRNAVESYMPVFLVGKCLGESISSATNSEFFPSFHQDGHIYSALVDNCIADDFIAVHLSGGTSEILFVHKESNQLNISIVGHTLDISAGKVIDRIGVKMGFDFPSGHYLEEAALLSNTDIKFKTSVKDCDFNFSGLESQALQNYDRFDKETICNSLQIAICKTISEAVINSCDKCNCNNTLFFGGVFSNNYLRGQIESDMIKYGIQPDFAKISLSSDNAVGLAIHAKKMFLSNHE